MTLDYQYLKIWAKQYSIHYHYPTITPEIYFLGLLSDSLIGELLNNSEWKGVVQKVKPELARFIQLSEAVQKPSAAKGADDDSFAGEPEAQPVESEALSRLIRDFEGGGVEDPFKLSNPYVKSQIGLWTFLMRNPAAYLENPDFLELAEMLAQGFVESYFHILVSDYAFLYAWQVHEFEPWFPKAKAFSLSILNTAAVSEKFYGFNEKTVLLQTRALYNERLRKEFGASALQLPKAAGPRPVPPFSPASLGEGTFTSDSIGFELKYLTFLAYKQAMEEELQYVTPELLLYQMIEHLTLPDCPKETLEQVKDQLENYIENRIPKSQGLVPTRSVGLRDSNRAIRDWAKETPGAVLSPWAYLWVWIRDYEAAPVSNIHLQTKALNLNAEQIEQSAKKLGRFANRINQAAKDAKIPLLSVSPLFDANRSLKIRTEAGCEFLYKQLHPEYFNSDFLANLPNQSFANEALEQAILEMEVAFRQERESAPKLFSKIREHLQAAKIHYWKDGEEGDLLDDEDEDEDDDEEGKSLRDLPYVTDLTEWAKEGRLNPFVGRKEILDKMILILSRKLKNNPILVGDPGVGKTALVEGLAWQIANETVPGNLRGFQIWSLDVGGLIAGTRFRGDFEKRIQQLLQQMADKKNAILFIDEIHLIVGAGQGMDMTLDCAALLKPLLARGALHCIGATTYDDFNKTFSKDKGLVRRFQQIDVHEPSEAEVLHILKGFRRPLGEFHGVQYSLSALKAAISLSNQYLKEGHQPDKAIDLMDQAGAFVKLQTNGKKAPVTENIMERVVAKTARIPEEKVLTSEVDRLQHLEAKLKQHIFGQDEAVQTVVKAVKRSKAGFGTGQRPLGVFLFVGPTGVGKTELSKQLANELGVELIRFDMSEYQESHTVARLLGAPPGYVGYDQGGLLTAAVQKNPCAVLLLDEIEKAHRQIYNVLLQVMDYGILTDSAGKRVDFSNIILIMTGNAGVRELSGRSVGFLSDRRGEKPESPDSIDGGNLAAFKKAIELQFPPEFRNRLDRVVRFHSLGRESLLRIVEQKAADFISLLKEKKIELTLSDSVKEWVLQKGFHSEFGARYLVRTFEEEIEDPFVDRILFGDLKEGGRVSVTAESGQVVIQVENRPTKEQQLVSV